MPDDAPRHLESLTISKLKSVAKHLRIDVTSCRQKKDYVQLLAEAGTTPEQVEEALSSRKPAEGTAPARSPDEMRNEIEQIAERGPSEKVLPAADEEEVERYIDRVLLVRPSFFEIDSEIESTWNHMIMADYHDALRLNSDTRSKMLDRFSTFQVFSCALAIRAAESILTSLGEAQGKTDAALKTALAEAKRAFVSGTPKHREDTLENLENLTSAAYHAFFEGSTRAEAELRTLLSDYESFGTQTHDAWRLLEIAGQARQSFNVAEYAKILGEAERAASRAKDSRAAEIQKSFAVVDSAIREAMDIGASVSVGEKEIKTAKEAFDAQAFKKAVDLLASIEHAADSAHLERLKDKDLREKQHSKVSKTIDGLESALREAASYGIDAQEGLIFVGRARGALVNRDIVNAAKLARHAKDSSSHIEDALDKERVDRGIARKVEEAKCGKCGREALYSFPNDIRKCIECGHSFSMVAMPATPTMEPLEKPVSGNPSSDKTQEESPKKKTLMRTLKKQ